MQGKGGCGVSAHEYSCAHGAQINFGNLTPYSTYVPRTCRDRSHLFCEIIYDIARSTLRYQKNTYTILHGNKENTSRKIKMYVYYIKKSGQTVKIKGLTHKSKENEREGHFMPYLLFLTF
jgi:hypothetical protein